MAIVARTFPASDLPAKSLRAMKAILCTAKSPLNIFSSCGLTTVEPTEIPSTYILTLFLRRGVGQVFAKRVECPVRLSDKPPGKAKVAVRYNKSREWSRLSRVAW